MEFLVHKLTLQITFGIGDNSPKYIVEALYNGESIVKENSAPAVYCDTEEELLSMVQRSRAVIIEAFKEDRKQ